MVIAFSRNERTHPNLVLQAQEIQIFCEDCKLGAPLAFWRGFSHVFVYIDSSLVSLHKVNYGLQQYRLKLLVNLPLHK